MGSCEWFPTVSPNAIKAPQAAGRFVKPASAYINCNSEARVCAKVAVSNTEYDSKYDGPVLSFGFYRQRL